MSSEVKTFLEDLEHSRKDDIISISTKINVSFPEFESEIKWNAPSFTFQGENVITLRIFPDPALQLILHLGSKKLLNPPDLRFEIKNLKHRWADSTRCVITIEEDLNWKEIEEALREWMMKVRGILK
ncbi:MAG: hypothetical protein ACKOXT_04645 [Actinomycetota bacterium]